MQPHRTAENIFNADIKSGGRYVYTDPEIYSAKLLTDRFDTEMHNLIKHAFPDFHKLRILDLGCGDGTYTMELFRSLRPELMTGMDIAKEAISVANSRVKTPEKRSLKFFTGDIYALSKRVKEKDYDLVILRSVLHHLDDPAKAIADIGKYAPAVAVIEPNGYNLILKVIERTSPYHRAHREKSYFPSLIDSWFTGNGYEIAARNFFSIVPCFCPTPMAKTLKVMEPFFETIHPLHKLYCGNIIAMYRKNTR
jgi:ubiquinone/menaquinone biosynthesis C-methylase UbiE